MAAPDIEPRQQVLEAAQLVYDTFWGTNLDTLLQPVPDYSDLKHLSKQRLLFLRLGILKYHAEVLLVCEEYKTVYKHLVSYKDTMRETGSGGVVVTGQPGIGVHLSLIAIFFTNNHHWVSQSRKNMFLVLSAVLPFK